MAGRDCEASLRPGAWPGEFLAANPVFTRSEFAHYCERNGLPLSARAQQSALRKMVAERDVHRSFKGIYETCWPRKHPASPEQDGMLCHRRFITKFISEDTVISHQSALQQLGVAKSASNVIMYSASRPRPEFASGQVTFWGTRHPTALRASGQVMLRTQGRFWRYTDMERTFVDCIRVPRLAMHWEEIWISYENAAGRVNTSDMADYALQLDEAPLAARVGYFMEANRHRVPCSDQTLRKLRAAIPRKTTTLDAQRRIAVSTPSAYIEPWNLLVPESVIHETWSKWGRT